MAMDEALGNIPRTLGEFENNKIRTMMILQARREGEMKSNK